MDEPARAHRRRACAANSRAGPTARTAPRRCSITTAPTVRSRCASRSTARKHGDRLTLDFSGTDPQAKGPVNTPVPTAQAVSLLAVIAASDPTIPMNSGVLDAVDFVMPPGTLVNPQYPGDASITISRPRTWSIPACSRRSASSTRRARWRRPASAPARLRSATPRGAPASRPCSTS